MTIPEPTACDTSARHIYLAKVVPLDTARSSMLLRLRVFGAQPTAQVELDLSGLLGALGYEPDEFVSVSHKTASGAYSSAVCKLPDAVAHAAALPDDVDVYFGVNPISGPARERQGRGAEGDVMRVSALYADLDIKPGACRDRATAEAIIAELSEIVGMRPSAITHSGNGLHPYWPISDGAVNGDTAAAKARATRWGRLVRAVARKHGAKADSVFDLARVLRAPGSNNCKGADPIPVRCYTDTGRPLTVAEIDAALEGAGVLEEDGDRVVDGTVVSAPEDWVWAESTCGYVRAMIDGWAEDLPTGRHQWLLAQAVRLACAVRLGCITEADYDAAATTLDTRMRELCETQEPVRYLPPAEVAAALEFGTDVAAGKTDAEARAELNWHIHDTVADPKQSQASRLVALALQVYRLGIGPDGGPFGYRESEPHIALDLRGNKLGLRQTLARDYYRQFGAAPSQTALASACNVLEGMAREHTPTPLHLRVAGGGIHEPVHIDVGDDNNRIIEISEGNWRLVNSSPHMFRRTELTAAMVEPRRGGDLELLWNYVNIADEDRAVLLAVLVDALIKPNTPKPVLGLQAEHGSAKSTSARCIVSLIDPSIAALRSPSRDLQQWITAASGSWVVAVDNLSHIPDWLSDAMCRAATGDGDIRRALYTDDGLSVFQFRRLVIINGIDVGGLKGDLADRLVPVELKAITEETRREEAEFLAAWDRDRSAILGGLLDLAAEVHAILPTLGDLPLPRMADFGRVLTCVDKILGTEGMQRYRDQRGLALVDSATSDSLVAMLIELKFGTGEKGMTAAEILKRITPSDPSWRRPIDWPKMSRYVTTKLNKNAPALRAMGWEVANDAGKNKDGTVRWILRPPLISDGEGDAGEDP